MPGIGVLREGPLHAAVKAMLAMPGDRLEVPVERFVIDIVRADGELVEVQTGGFAALGRKLDALLDDHRVRIVHPIAAERRIVRVGADGEVVSIRRSPKQANAIEVFDKLVAFPSLVSHPNLTIEALLLREDHVRDAPPSRVLRQGRDRGQRRLLDMLGSVEFRWPRDFMALLPEDLADPFSTRQLAVALGCTATLAQRAVYCLRAMGMIEPAPRDGRTPRHRRCVHLPSVC